MQQNDENLDLDDDHVLQQLHQWKTQHGSLLPQLDNVLQSIVFAHKHFQPKDSDIILATMPKSGTTWLKALTYSIINRSNFQAGESPLISSNPHQLVPFLENNRSEIIQNDSGTRILSTHIPYQWLPKSILNSKAKIIYLCRNPLDVFTSTMAFVIENRLWNVNPPVVEEEFELFCNGIQSYGPFWDHILGYWKRSLKTNDNDCNDDDRKVLFLKYEDLKKDIKSSVMKMAEFLGFSFSSKEEEGGRVEEIIKLCSFENLKNLEVNRRGEINTPVLKIKNSTFFRKGEVGDWKNYLNASMAKVFENLMEEKFAGSGLEFEL